MRIIRSSANSDADSKISRDGFQEDNAQSLINDLRAHAVARVLENAPSDAVAAFRQKAKPVLAEYPDSQVPKDPQRAGTQKL